MGYHFNFIFLLVVGVQNVQCECPSVDSLPVMTDDNTNFYCAAMWFGKGHPSPIQGCNECDGMDMQHWFKGDDGPGGEDGYWPMGSVIVKAGCTLYAFEVTKSIQFLLYLNTGI